MEVLSRETLERLGTWRLWKGFRSTAPLDASSKLDFFSGRARSLETLEGLEALRLWKGVRSTVSLTNRGGLHASQENRCRFTQTVTSLGLYLFAAEVVRR